MASGWHGWHVAGRWRRERRERDRRRRVERARLRLHKLLLLIIMLLLQLLRRSARQVLLLPCCGLRRHVLRPCWRRLRRAGSIERYHDVARTGVVGRLSAGRSYPRRLALVGRGAER